MRARHVLLAALALLAAGVGCSDSITGVKGPSGERYTTIASASRVRFEDSILITVEISNPTSNTLHLVYDLSANVYGQYRQGSTTFGDTGGTTNAIGVDTIVLAPGQKMRLSPDPQHFATPGVAEGFGSGETWSLEAGTWKLRACVFVPSTSPLAQVVPRFTPVCGQDVDLTITQ